MWMWLLRFHALHRFCAAPLSRRSVFMPLRFCAGFSNVYNTLKFNVSNSTLNPDRPDNIVFVRNPAPPSMPEPPPFPVWPLPKSFTSGEKEAASSGPTALRAQEKSQNGGAPVSWTAVPGLDNYGFDIKTASECKSNVTCLEAACVSLLYCAGFRSAYNTLKFNVSN